MQIAIVLYPGMTALDALGPYEILRLIPGADLRFVHHRVEPIVADSGILVIGATHTFEETPSPDILLVPGSTANTVTAMADNTLISWLRKAHQTTRLTLSVCSGALILAAAGILKGKPATTHWIAQDRLAQFGADPQPEDRIVRSGKVITAAGVSAGLDLALAVVDEICGRERAQIIQLLIEYDPKPHLQAGHPTLASDTVFETARKEMLTAARNPRDAISIPKVLWQGALAKVRKKLGLGS